MDHPDSSAHMPWRDMYNAASSSFHPPFQDLRRPSPPRRTRSLTHDLLSLPPDHSFSLHRIHHLDYHSEAEPSKSRSFSSIRRGNNPLLRTEDRKVAFHLAEPPPAAADAASARIHPWPDGGVDAPSWRASDEYRDAPSGSSEEEDDVDERRRWSVDDGKLELALYIAAAHGAMAALSLAMYGLWVLLDDYRKPIMWAILCSMPLREIQRALVEFWEKPLREGFLQTMLAVPAALLRAVLATLMDARAALCSISAAGSAQSVRPQAADVGFSTLMQWLISFALCSLAYESFGPATLATAAFVGMLLYAAASSLGIISLHHDHPDPAACWFVSSSKSDATCRTSGGAAPPSDIIAPVHGRSLHFFTALLLIFAMIAGSIAGLALFSYKVGIEGKGAVVALKAHIQRSNYSGGGAGVAAAATDVVGLRRWMEENRVPDVIESYAGRAYDSVTAHMEGLAEQYNLSDVVKAGREYVRKVAVQKVLPGISMGGGAGAAAAAAAAALEKLQSLRAKLRQGDFRGVYGEMEQLHEEVIGKGKEIGRWWVEVGKAAAGMGAAMAGGAAYLVAWVGGWLATGAVRLGMQAGVFFSVLYYFIVSEEGGAVGQAMKVAAPLVAKGTRRRCAAVLEETASNVLLSTAKAAIFQASFTWLLFRSFRIHFLYTSTLLALFSALFSFPCWLQLASLLGAVQLALQGVYARAALLAAVHVGFLRYGLTKIYRGTPRSFAGMSLAVGIVLFWHSPERAIMGPLIITLLLAMKNLYFEFSSKSKVQERT